MLQDAFGKELHSTYDSSSGSSSISTLEEMIGRVLWQTNTQRSTFGYDLRVHLYCIEPQGFDPQQSVPPKIRWNTMIVNRP